MEQNTSGLDLHAFAARLNALYDPGVTALSFLPIVGEESYAFLAERADGSRSFMRVQMRGSGLSERAGAALLALREQHGLTGVVAPERRRDGRVTLRFGGYGISVFPFVPGKVAYTAGISDEGLARVARLLAALHACGDVVPLPPSRRERFSGRFTARIQRALAACDQTDAIRSPLQERLCALMRAERGGILEALARTHELAAAARRLRVPRVLRHGDPNLANLIVDEAGEVRLVDWGDLAFGPRERDLFAFTDDRFELFLHHYLTAAGSPPVHPLLFEFYELRWAVGEIADYSNRMFFGEPHEQEHAWREIQPYLPVPCEAMGQKLAGLRALLPTPPTGPGTRA